MSRAGRRARAPNNTLWARTFTNALKPCLTLCLHRVCSARLLTLARGLGYGPSDKPTSPVLQNSCIKRDSKWSAQGGVARRRARAAHLERERRQEHAHQSADNLAHKHCLRGCQCQVPGAEVLQQQGAPQGARSAAGQGGSRALCAAAQPQLARLGRDRWPAATSRMLNPQLAYGLAPPASDELLWKWPRG